MRKTDTSLAFDILTKLHPEGRDILDDTALAMNNFAVYHRSSGLSRDLERLKRALDQPVHRFWEDLSIVC